MSRDRSRRVARRGAATLALVALSTVGIAPEGVGASTTPSDSSVTKTRTVTRTYLDDGKRTTVDSRNVTFTVERTSSLRSLQLIHVSWSGAHPTGGVVPDSNSDFAQNEEYPFAIFECRGADSAAHPITPATCWTQYADERFAYGTDAVSDSEPSYPAWRSDATATAAQRRPIVGAPSTLTTECHNSLYGTTTQRWVPFAGADGQNYPGGLFGCAGLPPEASPANLAGNLTLPSNETFGVTDAKGNGSADFDVFTAEDHATLGCSETVACSLVAVPIMGVSCDPEGSLLPADDRPSAAGVDDARSNCEQSGRLSSGAVLSPGTSTAPAVNGSLWWSPSNWANRISVPLGFAPPDNACSLNDSGASRDIYGSELLVQATTSWAPYFCRRSNLFTLNHVQTPEPQARSILANGGIDAAFTSRPPDTPYSRPTVNAPVAVTGFGIAFNVDGTDKAPKRTLKLNARLLAKLMTESYPDITDIQNSYPALSHNPLNITYDPEFKALNPGVPSRISDAAATLLSLNTDSDVMYALTSYIEADPEARLFMNGRPDPWGMRVNPNYSGLHLPTYTWPLADDFEPTDLYQVGRNDCLYYNPTPYLPLVAAPQARLVTIGQDMQFSLGQSQTTCVLADPTDPANPQAAKLVATGRQTIGTRAMFGIVSLGDAAREGLNLASLQTQTDPTAVAQFTDDSGRTFAAPTTDGLRAAARELRPAASSGTFQLDYGQLRSDGAARKAYPGTMPVYAAIATSGLGKSEAADYGIFLTFAADRGQRSGTDQGDLPDGYLPMTSANGLSALADYTTCAAAAVRLQNGVVPTVGAACPAAASRPPVSTGGSNTTTSAPTSRDNPSAAVSPAPAGGTATSAVVAAPGGTPSSSSTPTELNAAPAGNATPSYGSGVSGALLPILLGLALLGFLALLVLRVGAAGKRTP